MGEIALDYDRLSDLDLATLVVRRDANAVRVITVRNNQRLYRAAWSVLQNRPEAEEAVQERTAERRERLLRKRSVTDLDDYREKFMAGSETQRSPEAEMMRRQIAKLLERAIANLPETFRPVFVLREIEGLSVEETADVLQIPKETVKTRLFRARRVYSGISIQVLARFCDTFPFADGLQLLSGRWRDHSCSRQNNERQTDASRSWQPYRSVRRYRLVR
jgi:RNA polymerase sigma-70 factor (ECF subfamily)